MAAAPVVDIGNGITVALTTSSFDATFQVVTITPPSFTREFVDTTHMGTDITPTAGTVGTMTKIAADHVDIGPMSMTGHFNPDLVPPFLMAATTGETITLTFLGADDAAGATWIFTGGLNSFTPEEMSMGEKMMVALEFQPITGVAIAAQV